MKRLSILSPILVLFGVLLLFTIDCKAQNDRYEKIRQGSYTHWKSLINQLNISMPDSLPPPAEDPDRPSESYPKEDSNGWQDSAGNTYARSPWGTWTNYDESKANPYSILPDPLKLNNGKKVTTPETWWGKKRPEIARAFEEEIYGKIPANVPAVKWQITGTRDTTIGGIAAQKKDLIGKVDNSSYPKVSVNIQLSLVTPAKSETAVPVMIHFGFQLPPGFEMPERDGPTWQEHVLKKGWGYVDYIPASVQPDNGAGLIKGIIGLVNRGEPREPDEWGALRAWAWGASRIIDYLETNDDVNANFIGVEGVSRYGKGALVAMAFDQRFAIALIGSSGKGGATLFRRNYGETIGILASSGEYHWFAGNFLKYAGPMDAGDLPVDTHELIAMCAPRPVFISTGSPTVEGRWMDNKGQFMAAVAAGPVYKLLGKEGVNTKKMPPVGTLLMNGELAFRQHSGGHTDLPNWPWFLQFANKYLNELKN